MKSPSHANRRNRSNIERERGAVPTLNSALTQITGAQPTLQANDDNGSFFPNSPWIVHLYIESISILYINDAISRPLRGDDRGAQKCCLFALSVFSCGCHPGRPSMHRRSPCRPSFCPRSFLFCKLGFSLSCLDRPQRLALKKWHCVEAKVRGDPSCFLPSTCNC